MGGVDSHRVVLSAAERRELWSRWKTGESAIEIARALSITGGHVTKVLAKTGGFEPPHWHRRAEHLRLEEREEISRALCAGEPIRQIARRLGRSPSTICREVARNGGASQYRAALAEQAAGARARRPKTCLLERNQRLCEAVAGQLAEDLSPEQISGWLKVEFEDDASMRISPETIYRSLFIQARGVLKKELMAHLRRGRQVRRPKTQGGKRGSSIADFISISERPAEVEDRAVPGHWEGDLIAGFGQSYVATLVERHSRFVVLVKVHGKAPAHVVPALVAQMQTLPVQLRRTLTWDRGSELAGHKDFSIATNMDVYFCDPSSPWQRGTNENTNGLLRQYLKKTEYIGRYSQAELDDIAAKLNRRPRKTLGFKTPAATLEAAVASTG